MLLLAHASQGACEGAGRGPTATAAAELLVRRRPGAFDDALFSEFDEARLARPLQHGAVRLLPAIANGPVLTTNFDRVLETAFEDAGRRFQQVLAGKLVTQSSRAIQWNQACLIKLHGDYAGAESRVLTRSNYQSVYGSDDPRAFDRDFPLPRILSQALSARPLLFLGCSLKSDRTTLVISEIAKMLPGTRHFALLSAAENTPERCLELESWNVRPLFYPAGRFGKIGEFLSCLAGSESASEPGTALPPQSDLEQALEEIGPDLDRLDTFAARLSSQHRWADAVLARRRQADVATGRSNQELARALEGLGEARWENGETALAEQAWADLALQR